MTAGLPIPAVLSTTPPAAGPAVPVIAATSGMVDAGPAQPVYVVTAADVAAGRFDVQAAPPLRMVLTPGRQASSARPIPVYIVSGSFGGSAAAPTYISKVQALNPIAYWPLNEASGTTAVDASGNGRNGAYSGTLTLNQAGIGDGNGAPAFAGGLVNVYSASLAAAFSGAAGTLALWVKVSGSGVWTDGAQRIIAIFQADGTNFVQLRKPTTSNALDWRYTAGGTAKIVQATGQSSTGYLHMALTWDKAADQMKAYLNGAQTGSTQTGLGTFAGSLASTTADIASASSSPTASWQGSVAHVALWTSALTAAQIATLAAPTP